MPAKRPPPGRAPRRAGAGAAGAGGATSESSAPMSAPSLAAFLPGEPGASM